MLLQITFLVESQIAIWYMALEGLFLCVYPKMTIEFVKRCESLHTAVLTRPRQLIQVFFTILILCPKNVMQVFAILISFFLLACHQMASTLVDPLDLELEGFLYNVNHKLVRAWNMHVATDVS